MINPYIGEVSCFAFKWAPVGWLQCQGQLVSVQQFNQLFALIGKTFGGDGISTFGLPKFNRFTKDGGQFCISTVGAPSPRNALPAETTIFPARPPDGWIDSRGELLKIAEYPSLFKILGNKFGGDGKTTFAAPDMFQLPPFNVPGNYGFCSYYIASDGSTAQGFIGEVKIFPSSVPPNGWLACDGRTLPTQQPNMALYSLIGTTYGGNGATTFGLPNITLPNIQGLQAFICQQGAYPTKP